jgi:hypothetical protein
LIDKKQKNKGIFEICVFVPLYIAAIAAGRALGCTGVPGEAGSEPLSSTALWDRTNKRVLWAGLQASAKVNEPNHKGICWAFCGRHPAC